MVAVTFSIPSNILLPSPLKAFIYEHSRQKVAAVAVEKKLYRDMKDVDKMLLTQSLENEFHAGNRRKR